VVQDDEQRGNYQLHKASGRAICLIIGKVQGLRSTVVGNSARRNPRSSTTSTVVESEPVTR